MEPDNVILRRGRVYKIAHAHTIESIPTNEVYYSLREKYQEATIEWVSSLPDWAIEMIKGHTESIKNEVLKPLRQ